MNPHHQPPRLKYRQRPTSRELLYIYDGDRNGVFHHLGSQGSSWLNPVVARTLTLTASSPTCRHTDPKALVSQQYRRTSFAGPKRELNGEFQTYWQADIGSNHRLVCNYYTIRTDGSGVAPRSFVLEGSTGGHTWEVLKRHVDDRTVTKPGQFYSWPVPATGAGGGFQHFRLRLEGPASDGSRLLAICAWELYGYMHELSAYEDGLEWQRGSSPPCSVPSSGQACSSEPP